MVDRFGLMVITPHTGPCESIRADLGARGDASGQSSWRRPSEACRIDETGHPPRQEVGLLTTGLSR